MGPILGFIQARMGSTRLPGKVLADLGGRPLLLVIVERLRRARRIDDAVVLTSNGDRDLPLRQLCEREGIECVTGSEHDVLDRFATAIRRLEPAAIVRITADCPLIDPAVIDELVELYLSAGSYDHVAVATGAMAPRPGLRRYPDGLDAEALRSSSLILASERAREPYEREHVTPYLWRRPDQFGLGVLQAPVDWGGERWTVDYPADLEFVRAIYRALAQDQAFGVRDVMDLLERAPQLREINLGERRESRPVR